MLTQMNEYELQLIYQNITQPNEINNNMEIKMEINDNEMEINDKKVETNNKKVATNTCRQKLIKIIKDLPDDQLKSAVHLLDIMRYSKGSNKGNLLSPFLQNKALNFVNSSLYKVGQDSGSLIQNNQALQKQITRLEHSNSKKSHKVKQLIGTMSQYKRKQRQHISKVRAAAQNLYQLILKA